MTSLRLTLVGIGIVGRTPVSFNLRTRRLAPEPKTSDRRLPHESPRGDVGNVDGRQLWGCPDLGGTDGNRAADRSIVEGPRAPQVDVAVEPTAGHPQQEVAVRLGVDGLG